MLHLATSRVSLVLLLVGLLACDATIASNDGLGETTSGEDGSSFTPCSDAAPCPDDETCFNGTCSPPPTPSECEPYALTMDGCPSDALCLAQDETSQACYAMPPCDADDTCPVGLQGAVCNVDYVYDKDEICMIGVCAGVEHCPTDWSCIKFAASDPLGVCGNGTFGSPCTSDLDCLSGACFQVVGVGFCQ